jgi:methyl-accepting chemotaxis protein
MPGSRCWEYLKCGKEQNCPAYPKNGANCWTVEGTLCRNQRQGDYDSKIGACRTECTFYNGVMLGTIRVI